jgi:hypothetical protein
MLPCEKLRPLRSALVTGPLPETQQLLGGIQRWAPLKIRARLAPLPGRRLVSMPRLRQQIERAVVGLALPLPRHRHPNRPMPFPPCHPPDIAPHLSDIRRQAAPSPPRLLNLGPARCQVVLISSRRSRTWASSRLGLPLSVRG